MIPNCRGCEEEFNFACENPELNLVQQELTHISERKHFRVYMVDDTGKEVIS